MSTILRTSRTPAIPSLLWKGLEPTTPRFTVFVVLLDLLAMAAATGLGILVPAGAIGVTSDDSLRLVPPPGIGTEALALIVLWLTMVALAGGYSTRRAATPRRQYTRLLVATGFLVGVLSLLALLLRLPTTTSVLLVTPALGLALLLLGRSLSWRLLRGLRSRGLCLRRAVVLSADPTAERLLSRLHRHPEVGVEVVGTVTDDSPGVDPDLPTAAAGSAARDPDRVDRGSDTRGPGPEDIVRTMLSLGADTLVVPASTPGLDGDRLRGIRWELDSHNFHMLLLPPLAGLGEERISLEVADDLPVLRVRPATYTGLRYVLKRSLDVLASGIGILLLTPVWFLIAALVRLGDGGPVFFVQDRVGTNGVTFPMVKFRTMVPDAEDALETLDRDSGRDAGNDVMFKMRHDPRVTRVGHVLRRFSLDELPQLFNVWLGHMSLVGPRPCLPREAALYEDVVRRRFLVRPGITGLWQTSGRSDLSWEDTVRLDLHYVENWTLRRDLAILARTVRAVLSSEGAY